MRPLADTGGKTVGQGDIIRDSNGIAERLAQLQANLNELADALCSAPETQEPVSEDAAWQLREAHAGGVDEVLLEARQLESLLARHIALLERDTSAATAPLQRRPSEASPGLFNLFGLFRKAPAHRSRSLEDQAASRLVRLIGESHDLVACLEDHQDLVAGQLSRSEACVTAQMAKLNAVAISAQPDADTRLLMARIEALEDFVDALIGMTATTNVFLNKLRVDAEERILLLHGLEWPDLHTLANQSPRLKALFDRADRGLLSAGCLAQRKLHLDEAFQRRAAQSRQVAGG
ncbi:hypothetical protein ACFSE1_11555 [Rhizobium helianthi]|uniref:CHAD domain-containing protein n=1 Tax=Rhizobium helianthi TaxID=1132695 RepID=A0ABW4M6E1_9HYPH